MKDRDIITDNLTTDSGNSICQIVFQGVFMLMILWPFYFLQLRYNEDIIAGSLICLRRSKWVVLGTCDKTRSYQI